MGFILWMIIIVAFLFLCKRLSKVFFRIGEQLDENEKHKRYTEACIVESLEAIRGSVVQPEEGIDLKESLLRANQEILEKEKMNKAMEDELGVKL